MKKIIYGFLITLFIILATACGDELFSNEVLSETTWDLKSNSDPDMIQVSIENDKDTKGRYNIVVEAGYKSGDVVLCCKNQYIAWTLIEPNDSYYNSDMNFRITRIDSNSLKIHFDENASGKRNAYDQLVIYNLKSKQDAQTLIRIMRSFGEVQQ